MMISKQHPAKAVAVAVEGSFLCMDDSSRKLSDLGVYKNYGRAKADPADLIDRKSRFNSNF